MPLKIKIWWAARAVLIIHGALALITWFNLPSRIPVHFDLHGHPTNWQEPTLAGWFIIFAVSLGSHVIMQLLMSPRAKGLWNIPHKERFLRLSPEQQQPVIDLMQAFGGFSALCIGVTMLSVNLGMYLVGLGHAKVLPWYIHVGMLAPTACLLLALIPLITKTNRLIREASVE